MCHRAVALWHADVSAFASDTALCESLLDERETRRMEGFGSEADRARYRVSHAAVRAVLALTLGIAPASVVYELGAHGKPALAGSCIARKLTFNLSHSGSHVLVAVARERAVGVDVERVRPQASIADVSARVFSAADRSALSSIAGDDRIAAFYTAWTRREAYLKARGVGLFGDATPFDVLASAVDSERRTRVGRFRIDDLEVAPGAAAALAAEGDDWCAIRYEATPDDLRAALTVGSRARAAWQDVAGRVR